MLKRTLEPEVMDSAQEAAEYDAMDNSAPNTAFVARLSELGASGRMIDLGTGPGLIPIMIASEWEDAEIFGVDLSREMLRIAHEHRAISVHAGRLRFEYADVRELPYDDASFDAVFSNTILHHIADPVPVLREAWRVLRPGGVLLIRDLFRPADEVTVEELVAQHAGDQNAEQQQLFRQSLHAALAPEEMLDVAGEAGLMGVEVVVDSDRHMSLQTRKKP